MEIHSICICGAGTMGSGIAEAAARSGIYTILFDLNEKVIEKAKSGIEKNLTGLLQKQKLTEEEVKATLSRLQFSTDLHECLADVFIEAIIEDEKAKAALFDQLAEINHRECIFASNTSSLSIDKLAEHIKGPERFIGLHFFNPATHMKLVEIVRSSYTSESTVTIVGNLAKQMGKTAVICRDSPGFIVNRVARPYYIEMLRLLEAGIVSIDQADRLMEASGFRMGPFQLMDLIGNDINYTVSCSVYDQLGRPERLKPSYLQEENLKQGKLGRKTGEGFYHYQNSGEKTK